jgi:hypothetical protein
MEAAVRARAWCIAVIACSAVAHADDHMSAAAKAHMERGLAEYQARHYDAAALEFQAAYTIDPRREILFAWAQAERLRGDCTHALTLYRQFVDLSPPADELARARSRIDECEQTLRATPQTPPAPPEPTTSPPAKPAPPAPIVESARPWYRDGLGAALVTAGVVAAATGGTFVVLSRSSIHAADYGQFAGEARSDDHRYTYGLIALAAGGAIASVGALRLVLADGPRASGVAVSIGASSISLSGHF